MNIKLVREHTFDVAHLDKILNRSVRLSFPSLSQSTYPSIHIPQDITPSNTTELLSVRNHFLSPSTSEPGFYFPFYAPCAAVHPALSSCTSVPLDRFFAVFKWMLPIYGALHFVPAVLFKRQAFTRDPGKVIVKAGLGSLRSSAFLGVFVIIYQSPRSTLIFSPY